MNEQEAMQALMEMEDDAMHGALSDLVAGKRHQPWRLIKAARLIKVWQGFAKTGLVRDEKGLFSLKEIALENIAKLQVNTILCGHESFMPYDLIEDYGLDPDNLDPDDTYFTDPESGQWRISDYAMRPLYNLASELVAAWDPPTVIYLIDRILAVTHQRSNLSAWFVEGGQRTLSLLASQVGEMEQDRCLT